MSVIRQYVPGHVRNRRFWYNIIPVSSGQWRNSYGLRVGKPTGWGRGGTQACALQPWVSWVVPEITPPGASIPLWATGTRRHPGTKLRTVSGWGFNSTFSLVSDLDTLRMTYRMSNAIYIQHTFHLVYLPEKSESHSMFAWQDILCFTDSLCATSSVRM